MKVLVDGDIIAYRAASSCELNKAKVANGQTEIDPDYAAFGRINQTLDRIVDFCDATDVEIWLTGPTNFRKDIYPLYKANRALLVPPTWLGECKEYLKRKHHAQTSINMEADDMLVINHVPGDTIICSNDKDFRANAVGHHYNFTLKYENQTIDMLTEQEVWYNFAHQMLRGDKVDHIIGPYGHGAIKTVEKYLAGWHTKEDLDLLIRDAYNGFYGKEWKRYYRLNYRLLRLLRSKDELDTIYREKETNKYPIWESQGEEVTAASEGQAL